MAKRSTTKTRKKARKQSPEHVALGLAIQDFRAACGYSQEELALRSDTHRTYMGGVERGERNPTYSKLLSFAAALEIDVAELIRAARRYL